MDHTVEIRTCESWEEWYELILLSFHLSAFIGRSWFVRVPCVFEFVESILQIQVEKKTPSQERGCGSH